MRAMTQMIVKADDADSATSFVEAEGRYYREFEHKALTEFREQLQDDDITQDQLDAVEQFCDLIRERRTRFSSRIVARKSRAAGLVRK
jgi:hypothetical protein